MTRSFLFVPGDSERKLEKAPAAGADALIVDLEDAVSPTARPAARQLTAEFVAGRSDAWVRINPIDGPDALPDLDAVLGANPAGIVLPKARNASDVKELSAVIDKAERENGIATGSIRILPLVTETPGALFSLGSYQHATSRLAGLTWGAEDLSAALGAVANRGEDGDWLPPYQMARTLCLYAAGAAEVAAYDTVYTDIRNLEGLARYAAVARRDGFAGMLAIHPGQVDTINTAFQPSAEEVEHAERVIELFEANPGAGVLSLDGKMLDRPHLVQAKRILELAKRQ